MTTSVTAKIGRNTFAMIWDRTHGRCWYCGIEITDTNYSLDHQTPPSKGGSGDVDNLVLCCFKCNASKHNSTVEEYRARLQCKLVCPVRFSKMQIAWLLDRGVDVEAMIDAEVIPLMFFGEQKDI